MKITTEEGQEFELVLDRKNSTMNKDSYVYNLKPIKKSGKKTYTLYLAPAAEDGLFYEVLDLTPTTANKLAEALDALVEYVTTKGDYASQEASDLWKRVCSNADDARESFQESQE